MLIGITGASGTFATGTDLTQAAEHAPEYSPDCAYCTCQGPDDCAFIPGSREGANHDAAPSCEPPGKTSALRGVEVGRVQAGLT